MYVYVRMHVLTQHRWYGHFIFYAMNMSDAGPGANTCMHVYRGLSYIELSYVSYTLDAFHSLYTFVTGVTPLGPETRLATYGITPTYVHIGNDH